MSKLPLTILGSGGRMGRMLLKQALETPGVILAELMPSLLKLGGQALIFAFHHFRQPVQHF